MNCLQNFTIDVKIQGKFANRAIILEILILDCLIFKNI